MIQKQIEESKGKVHFNAKTVFCSINKFVSGNGIERYASSFLCKRKILFTADKKTSVQIDEFVKCGNGVAVPVRCTVFSVQTNMVYSVQRYVP